MNNHLTTAMYLDEIAQAVVTLDMILPALDLDKIAPHQRAGFLNSLDRVHDHTPRPTDWTRAANPITPGIVPSW